MDEPHLPIEVWQRVGAHMDPSSRARMAGMSRTYRDTFSAASDPRAWIRSVVRSGKATEFIMKILKTGQYADYLPELYASLSMTDRDVLRYVAQAHLMNAIMRDDIIRVELAIEAGAFPMASYVQNQLLEYARSHHQTDIYNLLVYAAGRDYPRQEAEAELFREGVEQNISWGGPRSSR